MQTYPNVTFIKTIYKLIFILLSSIALWACKKDKPSETPTNNPCPSGGVQIGDSVLLKCKFKAGSFWVFKDSLSGNIDTLSLDASGDEAGVRFIPLSGEVTCMEANNYHMKMLRKGEMDPTIKTFTYIITPDGMVAWSKNYYSAPAGDLPVILYQKQPSSNSLVKIHDTFLMGGQTYYKVCESRNFSFIKDDHLTLYQYKISTYFSAELGPVQFDYFDKDSGALIRRQQVIYRHIVR